MDILRKYKRFILLVTIPVLLLFISNSLINKHNHIIRGYVVTHAHPFNKNTDSQPLPYHNHTDAEIIILNLLGDFDVLLIWFATALFCLVLLGRHLPILLPGFHPGPPNPVFLSRGPPVYTF